jgi:DNA-binding transcriptional LysR family regulator
MSQPSASARLSRLERQLAVPLLVRSTRGSQLTPNGEAVLAWASSVIQSATALVQATQALREGADTRLRVAASLTIAEYCLTPWLLTLRRQHPRVHVGVNVANSHDVCQQVRSGQADVGFIESPEIPQDFTSTPVGSDRVSLVVSPHYPLAVRAGKGLHPHEIPDLPLLLREPGSGTREAFLAGLTAALRKPVNVPHAVELGSTSTIIATARAGGGVGVVSARAVAADLAAGTLVELEVHDLSTVRPLTAIWAGRLPTPLAGELVRLGQTACSPQ